MAKRVRAARHYQRRDAAVRMLADHARPSMRKAFREALSHLGSLVPTKQVLHFARSGDWHNLKRAINWGHYREVLKAPFGRIIKLRHAGAELGVQKINGIFGQARRHVRFRKMWYDDSIGMAGRGRAWQGLVSPGLDNAALEKDVGSRFNFDLLDEDTQDRIREAQDELIQQLEQDARDTIDTVVINGARDGLGPDDIASDIRDMIGLTDRQAQAVMNYQRMLYELDPQALQRQLRNTEYDAILQDAIDAGSDLQDAAVEAMVDDYIENYLDYRANAIAQTESTNAANVGLHDAYRQAVDRGALPEDAITRFWQLGDHPCEICESIVDMNPDGVGVNEDFDSIAGPIDNPAVHTHCMCSVEYVTDLDKVPDEEE